jgi:hypothetical protein
MRMKLRARALDAILLCLEMLSREVEAGKLKVIGTILRYDRMLRLPPSDSDASDDGGKKHSQSSRASINGQLVSPARRTSTIATEGAHNIATAISSNARRSMEELSSAFKSGASGVRNEISGEAREAADQVTGVGHKLRLAVRRNVRRSQKQIKSLSNRWRLYLSDAQHVTAMLLIFEGVVLVSHLMPLTNTTIGQKSVTAFIGNLAGRAGHAHLPLTSLAVPQLWALLTAQFWRPILLWFAWTVAIPIVASREYAGRYSASTSSAADTLSLLLFVQIRSRTRSIKNRRCSRSMWCV